MTLPEHTALLASLAETTDTLTRLAELVTTYCPPDMLDTVEPLGATMLEQFTDQPAGVALLTCITVTLAQCADIYTILDAQQKNAQVSEKILTNTH